MFVSGFCVLVRLLAMFVSRFGVFLRLFVFIDLVMMGCLMMMMMRRSVVMSGGLMMMLTGRMLRVCHNAFLLPVRIRIRVAI